MKRNEAILTIEKYIYNTILLRILYSAYYECLILNGGHLTIMANTTPVQVQIIN